MPTVLSKVLIFICLVLHGTLVAGSATSQLPRTSGALSLGMPVKEFKKATGAEPSGCATCVDGEQYSELTLNALPTTRAFLERLGFSNPGADATVDCFFYKDRLYLIRVGDFNVSSKVVEPRVAAAFGPPTDSSSNNGVLQTTWSDAKTTMVVSGTGAFTDVIMADVKVQRLVANKKPDALRK